MAKTSKKHHYIIFRGFLHRFCFFLPYRFVNLPLMDWFKGKTTGTPIKLMGKIQGFPTSQAGSTPGGGR
jgi:hypothetical protein